MSGQEELGVVGQIWYRVYDRLQSGGNEATEPALRHLDLLDVFSSLAPHWCRGDSWVAAPCTWTADGLADRERVFFVLVTVLLLSSTYISLYFYYEVIVGKWNLFGLRNFKITSRLPPPPAELVRRATVETAINHLIVRPLVLFAAYPWIRMRLRFDPENLPVASTAVLHVVFAMMFDDFWFYWVHRLCHEVSFWNTPTLHGADHIRAPLSGGLALSEHPQTTPRVSSHGGGRSRVRQSNRGHLLQYTCDCRRPTASSNPRHDLLVLHLAQTVAEH